MTSLHNVPVQGVCQRAKAAKRLPDAPEVSIVVATSLTSCKEDEEGGGGGGGGGGGSRMSPLQRTTSGKYSGVSPLSTYSYYLEWVI